MTAMAGTPAGYAEYIIPFDEDVFVHVTDPVAGGAGASPIAANNSTFTLISVTAWSDTVTVYYDHWENGYGYDEDRPDATADEKYTIDQSDTLNFNSLNVPRPRTGGDGNTYIGNAGNCWAQPAPIAPLFRNTPNYCYDGRDRIITIGGATTVTRGGYINAPGPGKLAAIGEEVFPLAPQLIRYVLPFGEGAGGITDYQRVMAVVQATEDNTVLQLDFTGDGIYDSFNTENGYRTTRADPVDGTTVVLNRGDTYIVDRDSDGVGGTLNRGTVILASKTIQVMYFYGETDSGFNTRAVAAFPNGFWGKEYYLSAGGATGANTNALIYNPNTSSITINWETAISSGSFNLAANTTGFFQNLSGGFIPLGSGLYLSSNNTFWGTSDVNSNDDRLDWGYSMVPGYLATDDQTVAWAPGNSPTLACNATDGRGNGLYLTPLLDNTTFFIDANGDGTPDTNASLEVIRGTTPVSASGSGYRANRLDSLYITGSNSGILATSPCDLTGARIYATGPFVMSFGENPDRASDGGGLDLGYTVLPSPGNWMDLALTVDKATNPVLVSTVAGATTVTYTLVVKSHEFPLSTLSVIDTLAPNWTYDNNSTVITYPNLSTLSGAAANPTVGLPTLTWGTGLFPGGMLPNQQITITFTARTTAVFPAGDITQNRVLATGTRTVDGSTQTFKATDFVFNVYSDSTVGMTMTKASSVPAPTPVSPGDPITYTVTVNNPSTSTAPLTGLTLLDPTPVGTTYVAASGSVTCERLLTVLDSFATNGSYTGNNGTANWNAAWTETSDNASAATGTILVQNNRVEFAGLGTAGRSINRIANVSGQTSATISFNLVNGGAAGIEAGETLVAEYSLDGGAFVTIGTLDGGTGYTGSNPITVPLSGNTTLNLRFRAPQAWSGGAGFDDVYIDDILISGASTAANVRDEFGAVAYNNNGPGNTANWVGNWSEVDNLGGGAASGLALVTGNALRLGWAENVRDEFAAVAYNNNGPNNSATWASDWVERDIQAAQTPGSGYVLVAGAGLRLQFVTSAVRDRFDNANYTTNDGTFNWSGNWTETGDDGVATTGIIIADAANNNLLNFGPGATGATLSRTAPVTGNSVTLSFALANAGADANEGVIAEYQLDSGAFVEIQRITNGVLAGTNPLTISTAGATSITLRFRSFETAGNNTFEAGDNVTVNDANIAFNNAVGAAAYRTVNLSGATGTPLLNFTAAPAALDAGGTPDQFVVECSVDTTFAAVTTLATFTQATPSVVGPWDLTPCVSATTAIRVRVSANYQVNAESITLDNVEVLYRRAATEVQRTVNLSGAVGSPLLSFTATAANLEASDTLVIEASTSASGPFTELATYAAGAASVPGPYNLSAYRSSTTTIRFRLTGNYDQLNETMAFDNVNIAWSNIAASGTFATAAPPEMISSAFGCVISPNQSMVVTYNVTADNPFPSGQTTIVNTATVSAAEIPVPLQATVTNIVLVPSSGSGTVGDRVWLDIDADGVFDPGETGLAGIQVTLKDAFGTPLAVTTTDSQGLYIFQDVAPGSGYYVQITGGMPGATTTTFADAFGTNGVFTGNNGTQNWLTNWTENNDDANAAAGDIQIANNRIEFRDTTDGGTVVTGESIQRSATVTDATSLKLSYFWNGTFVATTFADSFGTNGVYTGSTGTNAWATNWVETGDDGNAAAGEFRVANNRLEIGGVGLTPDANDEIRRTATATNATSFVWTYDWSQTGVDAADDILVQYSTDGLAWTTLRTLDGTVPDQTFSDYIPWTPTDATIHIRYFSEDQIEDGEQARFDNVVLQRNGVDNDNVIVEYSTNGTTWTTARTLGNLTPAGAYTDTIPWTPTDATAFVRFRAADALETGELATIDSVVLEKVVGASLIQTTDTVRDDFNINGTFTGNTGTLDWATNWTETADDANATTGDIKIANNRIEFGGVGLTVEANDDIRRSVTVTGATSIEVQYDWGGTAVGGTALLADGSDEVIVEYSIDGATWLPLRTINGAAAQTFTDTVAWAPTNNTLFLRYRALDALESGKVATVDNVQVRFPQSLRTAAFDLSSGESYTQADLGFRAAPGTATIGDLVWVDANNDQTRNPGEPGLVGITVDLYRDTNGDGVPDGSPIASTVTGVGGAYLFTGIAANGTNDYVVTMNTGQAGLTPAGYTATTFTLFYYANLPSGSSRVDADFGFRNPSSTFTITDGVWLDNGAGGGTAGDGIKNGTEAGIANVTVSLLDSGGSIIASTSTASNGTFSFSGVPGGANYSWRITDDLGILNDYFGTTPSALSAKFQMPGNLTGNLTYITPTDVRHFGYNQTRSIGDTVFNDSGVGGGTLNNGIQDGSEPGIAGVTVQLFRDVDNDGVYEPGGDDGAVYATQVTDVNGKYLFGGLPSGSRWFVNIDNTQSALSGYTLTTSDYAGAAGHQRQVTPILSGTGNRLDIDYGYRAATPFAISGVVWNDANRNGVNNTEAGYQAVTLELLNNNGDVIATTSTAADGTYSFTGLPAATYVVRVTDDSGVVTGAETTFEKTEGATPAFPTPPPAYNGQETVVLAANVTDVNFGYYRPALTRAVIASFVAQDVNGAVALEWTTASEVGTVGFFLKRWSDRDSRYVDVTPRLFPALLTAPQGGTYRYIDADASTGEDHQYLLVEVEASGKRLTYGPYKVNTRWTAGDAEASAVANDAELSEKGASKRPHVEMAARPTARAGAGTMQQRNRSTRRAQAAKIGVTDLALYRVGIDQLEEQGGLTLPRAWANTFRLTNRGREVSFLATADGVLFYGTGTESSLEPDNVYQFATAAARTPVTSRRNPRGARPKGNEVFTQTVHVEQDLIGANNIYTDPEGDFWVWDYVFAGYGNKSLAFRADGAIPIGQATVAIRLKGGTETPGNPDHHATFTLNGTPIGDVLFNDLDEVEKVLEFDSSLLLDGANVLEVDGLTDTGAPYSLFYIDSFDVNYQSRYRAYRNQGRFEAAGNASVFITGFTRADISVFDVTNPVQPVQVLAPVSLHSDGTYGAVVASTNPRSVYFAATPDAIRTVARILPDTPSSLKDRANTGAYLVITTDELKATARTLADYRSDLPSQVIDIEDIYDEFNFGNANPHAIREFLNYAKSNWRTAPRYVVLAGDGNYDYKNVQGAGQNLIPPMMVSTPSGLFPSDSWFGTRANSSQVEIAVGRLPVTTENELAEVIRKIVAREAALAEAWMQNTLLLADNPDDSGDYVGSTEAIAGVVPPGTPVVRGYLTVEGLAETRTRLLDGLNAGAGYVSYIGHGGFDQLADESLLTSSDLPLLTNADRPGIMTAMTCLTGSSGLPGYSSLGELLVRQQGGGLAALWAPSGMSENRLATLLGQEFYRAAFDPRVVRIGDAIRTSRKVYRGTAQPQYMLDIYNLLGDPAMRIR